MRQPALGAHPVKEVANPIIAIDDAAVARPIQSMDDDLHDWSL